LVFQQALYASRGRQEVSRGLTHRRGRRGERGEIKDK